MAKKQVHWSIKNIAEKKANYNLVFGEKSNGKSYQVKHRAINNYLNTGNRFILMRRWVEDMTNLWVEKYFSDVDVEKLTDGRYNIIICYRKEIYFATVNEEGKTIKGEIMGYAVPLRAEQHFSSGSFLDVNMIVYEEFMERGGIYIAHEPDRLMAFYNTVDRKQGRTELWLVGNTVTRVNPYLRDWGLQNIIRNIKQGQIMTKVIHNEENDVTIAVEFCKSSGGKTLAIGNAAKMIDSGAWQTDPQPHLPKSKKCYKCNFKIGFYYKDFRFMCEYLLDKEDPTAFAWFIYPKYNDFKKDIIVFSDKFLPTQFYQHDIYNLTFGTPKLRALLQNFREGKIFYSDDLCGTDFKAAIDFIIRK